MKFYDVESEILLRECNNSGLGKSRKEKWLDYVESVKLMSKIIEDIEFLRVNGFNDFCKEKVNNIDGLMIDLYYKYSMFKK